MVIRFDNIPDTVKCTNNFNPDLVDWSSLSEEDIASYFTYTDVLLSNVYLPKETIICKNSNCTDIKHKIDVSVMYNHIVTALFEASKPLCKPRKKGKARPGWNTYVAEFYAEACEATKSWAMAGKPRQGPIFEYKKHTNAKYKYAIRYINKNEQTLRADSMAKKLLCKNSKAFWKEVKFVNNCKPSLPCTIDGVSGANAIAALWQQHYNKLFNCVPTEFYKVDNVEGVSTIKTHEVYQVIQNLSVNKSTGMDSISAEHVKLASPRLAPLLHFALLPSWSMAIFQTL